MSCFSLKAICSKGVVLLAVGSEVLVRCGIRGLTRLIAQFIGMSFSILCSCDLPVSEQSSPACFFRALDVFVQEKTCCCLYCQLLTTVT